MEKNKTGKYLKYAIGEIILVVIGILIAIQINNWNETRKEKVVIETIYVTIKNDLKNDIAQGKTILEKYALFEPYYTKFVNGTFTEEDYDACKCGAMFTGFYDLYLNNRGFDLLKQTNNELIKNSELTDNILNFYNEYLINFELTEISLNEFLHEQLKKLSNNKWWSDYNSGVDETGFRDYLVNNENAKNELSNFTVLLIKDYLITIDNFIREAEVLIAEIDNSNGNVSNQLSPNHDFEKFKVALYEGALAEPDFNTAPDAKQFMSRIIEACKNGINFAGKYTLVIWGCGTSCQSGVVVDRTNGKIYEGYYSSLGSEFKKDSRMIIINSGLIDETTDVIDDQNMIDLSVELWNGSEFIKVNN